jgi:O-antigen/teichoic acid export membrane protein
MKPGENQLALFIKHSRARARNLVISWGKLFSLSVLDQGLLSGSNFIMNILLVRWLVPEAYGGFSVAFLVFLFMALFHNALVLEPMSVLGPARYQDAQLRGYIRTHFWLSLCAAIGLSALVLLLVLILSFSKSSLLAPLLGVTMAMPFILSAWFFRRACYLSSGPGLAWKGSLVYSISLFGVLFSLRHFGLINHFSAYLVYAAASLVNSLFVFIFLEVEMARLQAMPAPGLVPVLKENWEYGKWIVGLSLADSPTFIYLPVVGAFAGLAQSGALRAMQNLFLPLQQLLASLATLLLPRISRQAALQGAPYIRRLTPRLLAINGAFAVAYDLAILVLAFPFILIMYQDRIDFYQDYLWLVPYLAVGMLLYAVFQSAAHVLRVKQRPGLILNAKLFSTAFFYTAGIALIYGWGLLGAVIGQVLGALLETGVIFYLNVKTGAVVRQEIAGREN